MTLASDPNDQGWLFQRDEIDLLEDELEDLYLYVEHLHLPKTAMESVVLKELTDTEDQGEDELTLELGTELLHNHNHHHEPLVAEQGGDERGSVREQLRGQLERDPLYLRAYAWSDGLFAYAKESYRSGQDTSKDMFRVYVNAKMIPIKLSIGRAQDPKEDPILFHLIEKEYELALIYLDRTLESLEHLVQQGYGVLLPFVSSGQAFRRVLKQAIDHLESPSSSFPAL